MTVIILILLWKQLSKKTCPMNFLFEKYLQVIADFLTFLIKMFDLIGIKQCSPMLVLSSIRITSWVDILQNVCKHHRTQYVEHSSVIKVLYKTSCVT